jgi:hypothetical protein
MLGVVAKGDFVEVLVDAGGGSAREYQITATRAGRRVEVKTSRSSVEVNELTRNGRIVRSARFMGPRVLAVVEHPVQEDQRRPQLADGAAQRPS